MAYQPSYYSSPYMYGAQNGVQPFNQPVQPVQPQQNGFAQPQIKNVYSEDEARQAQIPIDGSTHYFYDANRGRIYAKRFDYQNGSFPFEIYDRIQPNVQTAPEYVTMDVFNQRLAAIENMIPKQTQTKAVKKNEPSE